MGLRLTTAPSSEPLTVAEAKAHLRLTSSGDDTYVGALITAARQRCEQVTNRALMPQTWDLVLEEWPCEDDEICLPIAGVTSITYVKYYDSTNVQQTWSTSLYQTAFANVLAQVGPVYGQVWPILYPRLEAVEIRFVAGYADAASVPAAIKQWMLLQIGHWYEHREAATDLQTYVTAFVDGLLDPYRAHLVA